MLPKDIPETNFWSFTVYDNQTRCSTHRSVIRARAARASRRPRQKRAPTAPRRSTSARPSLRGFGADRPFGLVGGNEVPPGDHARPNSRPLARCPTIGRPNGERRASLSGSALTRGGQWLILLFNDQELQRGIADAGDWWTIHMRAGWYLNRPCSPLVLHLHLAAIASCRLHPFTHSQPSGHPGRVGYDGDFLKTLSSPTTRRMPNAASRVSPHT